MCGTLYLIAVRLDYLLLTSLYVQYATLFFCAATRRRRKRGQRSMTGSPEKSHAGPDSDGDEPPEERPIILKKQLSSSCMDHAIQYRHTHKRLHIVMARSIPFTFDRFPKMSYVMIK